MKRIVILLFISIIALNGCIKPTDPDSPVSSNGGYKIVGHYLTKGNAQDLVIVDTVAYLAQGEGGLAAVNIKEPDNPQELAVLFSELRGYSKKIAYHDNAVYLAAGSYGVSVVDVSQPQFPVVSITNLEMRPSRSLYVYNNFLLAGISEQGVKIADISMPIHPDVRGSIKTTPGYAQSMYATDEKKLLVTCGEMGLAILNISNLESGFESFEFLGWIDTPGYAEDVTIKDGTHYALVASGTYGLQIIDFSDKDNLKIVGSYDPGGYSKEICYRDNLVYMTTEKNGLQVINIDDISAPKLVARVDTKYAMGLAVEDEYIYIADDIEGLIVIEKP